jgi:raffinose/stachyose/melibiose transport system permease protein
MASFRRTGIAKGGDESVPRDLMVTRGAAAARTLIWLAFAVLMLYPLIWAVMGSLKGSNLAIFEHPFALPHRINLANYVRAVREGRMGEYFINSLWVTGLSTAATVFFGVWAGFALSKSRFPFQKIWLALFFGGMILPVQSYIIPMVGLLQHLGIHDSLWALILPYTAQNLPMAVLLLAAYFRALPVELEEAARLDGVGTPRFYFSILMPVARPAVATVVVISCLNTWNEFLMAMLFIVDPSMRTLPIGMIAFESAHNTDYPSLLAGLSLIAVPTLLAYAMFNKQVIRGVLAGTVK